MKKLKGVCVGAGYFSHFQYDAWRRIPEVEIVAFSDLDKEHAETVQKQFGIQQWYADYREMLDRETPDFVDIITPPNTHAEICREAGLRGVHILCQKPLAPTLEQATQMVKGAAETGVRFMVNENFRFQPWHREIKRLIVAGEIGGVLHTVTFRTRMGDGWGPQAYLPRQPYFHQQPRLLVYETGVHFIDTFRYLCGEIDRVTAWLRRLNPVIKGEDCGLLVFEFASGALGSWDANRFNEPNCAEPRYTFGEFLVEGVEGAIRLYSDGRLTVQKLGQPEREVEYVHERRGFAGDCCFLTQRHFADRMLDGQPFETNGEDYLRTLAVQEAAYRSADRGQPEPVVES